MLLCGAFRAGTPNPLIGPCFVLCGGCHKVVHVFLCAAARFVSPSACLRSKVSVVSGRGSSLLGFVKRTVMSKDGGGRACSRVRPTPSSNSLPLTSGG